MNSNFDNFLKMSKNELFKIIADYKNKLKDKVIIPVHHYQHPDIVKFADYLGDSYKLSLECSKTNAEYIVFCGVLFMAEGASILSKPDQKVLIPDPSAGCPMADMADVNIVEKAFNKIQNETGKEIAIVLYINSYADLKDFCGKKNGSVCTSSNAEKIIKHFLAQNKIIFFLPDYYLGKNTAVKMNINNDKIFKIKKDLTFEGSGNLKNADFILWDGFCPIHQNFKLSDIVHLREQYKDIKIMVHPESPEEVVNASDMYGSTEKIYTTVKESKAGSVWGIGTETTFVNRIALENPDKTIIPLKISQCKNMIKITPSHLANSLDSIINYNESGSRLKFEISVKTDFAENARKALNTMIDIVQKSN